MAMLIDLHEIGQQLAKVEQEARYDLPSGDFDLYQLTEIPGSDEMSEEIILANLSFKEVALYATGLQYLPYSEL